MRKGMKRIVSAVIAAVSAATLALTALAADYTSAPIFPSTPSQTTSVSTSELKETVSAAAKGETATVTVSSVKTLSLTSSVIKALDKADSVLKIEAPKAEIEIDASTITKVRKVDLSMKVYSSAKRAVVDMRSKKDFGCEVKITLTKCKMSAERLAKAHVYCDGEDLGPVELNEDGLPVITVTKGGKYEIK